MHYNIKSNEKILVEQNKIEAVFLHSTPIYRIRLDNQYKKGVLTTGVGQLFLLFQSSNKHVPNLLFDVEGVSGVGSTLRLGGNQYCTTVIFFNIQPFLVKKSP